MQVDDAELEKLLEELDGNEADDEDFLKFLEQDEGAGLETQNL